MRRLIDIYKWVKTNDLEYLIIEYRLLKQDNGIDRQVIGRIGWAYGYVGNVEI